MAPFLFGRNDLLRFSLPFCLVRISHPFRQQIYTRDTSYYIQCIHPCTRAPASTCREHCELWIQSSCICTISGPEMASVSRSVLAPYTCTSLMVVGSRPLAHRSSLFSVLGSSRSPRGQTTKTYGPASCQYHVEQRMT
jgi:hypothetical protein